MEYMIALVIETEEGQGDPADWDWECILDTPLPVSVIASCETAVDSSVQENMESFGDVIYRHYCCAKINKEDDNG